MIVCLSVSLPPHALTHVSILGLPYNQYELLRFVMACSFLKIEYVTFIFRLQDILKRIRLYYNLRGKNHILYSSIMLHYVKLI